LPVGVISLAIAWLCGVSSRAGTGGTRPASGSEGFHRLIGNSSDRLHAHQAGRHIVIDSATSGLHVLLGYTDELQSRPGLADPSGGSRCAADRAGAPARAPTCTAGAGHRQRCHLVTSVSAHPERGEDGT
jgi:hypothetical protein